VIADGNATLGAVGTLVFDEILAVANGRPTVAELRGNREFVFARVNPDWDT